MAKFKRTHHQQVARVLTALNPALLAEAECYFGGGTQLAMRYGEYRESRDIDFLCSRIAGYRLLRSEVSNNSLGKIAARPLMLGREVRSDRDAIRTFIELDGVRIKFEILLEARITLTGTMDKGLGVPVLAPECAIAEKLLANSDRGLDIATSFRDLIDLAFVVAQVKKDVFDAARDLAREAYGESVMASLIASIDAFNADRSRAAACMRNLGVDATPEMRKGLRLLAKWVGGA